MIFYVKRKKNDSNFTDSRQTNKKFQDTILFSQQQQFYQYRYLLCFAPKKLFHMSINICSNCDYMPRDATLSVKRIHKISTRWRIFSMKRATSCFDMIWLLGKRKLLVTGSRVSIMITDLITKFVKLYFLSFYYLQVVQICEMS